MQAAATARVVAMTTLHPPSVQSYLSYMNGVGEGEGTREVFDGTEEEGFATRGRLTPNEGGGGSEGEEEEEEEEGPPYTSGDEEGSAYFGEQEEGKEEGGEGSKANNSLKCTI